MLFSILSILFMIKLRWGIQTEKSEKIQTEKIGKNPDWKNRKHIRGKLILSSMRNLSVCVFLMFVRLARFTFVEHKLLELEPKDMNISNRRWPLRQHFLARRIGFANQSTYFSTYHRSSQHNALITRSILQYLITVFGK